MFLRSIKAFDGKEFNKEFLVPLEKITLIGGFINDVGPTRLIKLVEKEAKKINPKNLAVLSHEDNDRQSWLANKFKNCQDRTGVLSKLLKLGDNSIAAIGVPTNTPDHIMIHRGEGQRVSFLGESTVLTRLAMIATSLINCQFLLVDEIERGLHHSCYETLWMEIFESSNIFNVQVVVTTYNLEMIEAFTRAAVAFDNKKSCPPTSYVEIARSAKTGELIAIKRDIETVMYCLEHDQKIRGET
jgi:hypothetical protein